MNKQFIDGQMLLTMLTAARSHLQEQEETINALNVFPVPDGDTGTNMSLTMEAALREVTQTDTSHVGQMMEQAANGSLMGARGNSGVILSQLFRGFSKAVMTKETLNVQDLALAMKRASDTAYKAVMKPTEGTILTVARESAEKAVALAELTEELEFFLAQVIETSNASLEKTPELLKVLKDAGVVDSGGKGLVSILEGAYNGLTGKAIPSYKPKSPTMVKTGAFDESLEYGYCTEFIIQGSDADAGDYREAIESFGDSMLVVGNDHMIKVHIHTNHPGKVLEEALAFGEVSDIKIDNMRLQHRHEVVQETENSATSPELPEAETDPQKRYGFITVAMGEGISKIFQDFAVDEVIEGGQTMNPSTEDFLNAIDRIHADHLYIMPNNGNIIMAAKQASHMTSKNVTVIPTKTVPQGISALLAFHSDADSQTNTRQMEEALQLVRTGQVTYAVRDTEMNGISIQKGEIIGLSDENILSSGEDIQKVTIELLHQMIREDDEILTLYYGEEVEESMATELEAIIETEYPELEVEIYYGGQPLYYYIVSLE